MRFLDIKKFWEARLGGQTSKSSQTAHAISDQNNGKVATTTPTKSNGPQRNKRSFKRDSESSDAVHTLQKTLEDKHQYNGANLVNAATIKDKTLLSSFHSPTTNGSKTEDNSKLIDVKAVASNGRESSQKKKRSSFTFALQAFNRKSSTGKVGTKRSSLNDVVPEKYVVAEKVISASASSSPTKAASLKKADLKSPFVNSDSYLEELSRVPAISSSVDSVSAPPSLHSSPRKRMQSTESSRYQPRSNVKFNKVQNFWIMREKKLSEKSISETRCAVCGCCLNNYFYEYDNGLYCEEDYWNKYGHRCKKCSGIITGPIMIAGHHRFHPECFSCRHCKQCISDGDLYALLLFEPKENSQKESMVLFCHSCHEELLSAYSCDSSDTTNCTMIQVVNFVPNLTDVKELQEESSKQLQSSSRGYGLTLKALAMSLNADASAQPIGQVVCGVNVDGSCAVLEGDVLLQINGLTVDSNAIDLIERLYDDNQDPLQLTIQRSVVRSTEMCFDARDCSPVKNSEEETKIMEEDLNNFSLLSKNLDAVDGSSEANLSPLGVCDANLIVDGQPQTHQIKEDSRPENFDSISAKFDVELPMSSKANNQDASDLKPAYCGPFSSFGSNSLCCNAISVPKVSTVNANNDNKTDLFSTDTMKTALSDSDYATNSDSLSPKPTCDQMDSSFVIARSGSINSSSSITNDEINDLMERRKSDVSIVMSESPRSRPGSNYKENSSIIYEDDVMSIASTVFSANEENDLAAELSRNALARTPTPKHSIANDSDSDHMSAISPRSKRMAFKRKSLTASEQDKQLLSPMEERLKVPARIHSLRSNNPPTVVMRHFSPRNRLHSPRILSVYSENVHDVGGELNRSESMRVHGLQLGKCPRVFRPCDLIHGEVLGQGFFGTAIKVTHRDTGEVMVLKSLNSLDENVEKSFLKEVKVMRNLVHQNVIRFIGVLYKDRRLNIITEFVENGTLKDLITNMENELPWQQRVHIARDISSGMTYLHSKNLIHRDLNSGNCFVKNNGTVLVADFGLARVHSKVASLGRKKRYTVVGNPYWMAPEMLHRNVYDERVDIFSFGIVLCEIIGRIDADPDYLPRANDFGLAVLAFYEKFCQHCPAFYFAIAVQSSSLSADDRPSFKVLADWFQMLTFREELSRLPEPPNLRNVIISVYSKYNLALPPNLYYPYINGPQVPRNLQIRPSSPPKSVESDRTPSDTDLEAELMADNDSTSQTNFFSNSNIASRL